MSQNTEHDWVERAKRGEPPAIAELYRRYWRAMPDDVEVASAQLYLEPWASARSGQVIHLAEPPFPLSGR